LWELLVEKRLAGIGDRCSLCSGCLRWRWNRHYASSTIGADGHLRSAACGNGRCSLWRPRIRIRANGLWWRAALPLELGRCVWVISSARAHTQRLGHLRTAHHGWHLQRRYNGHGLAIAAAACKRQLLDYDCAGGSVDHHLGESATGNCWQLLRPSCVWHFSTNNLLLRGLPPSHWRCAALRLELDWSARLFHATRIKHS
jgi:hypothetical protein